VVARDQYLGIGLPAFLPRFLILRHVPFFVAGIAFYRITMKGLTPPRAALILAALAAAGWIDGLWGREVPPSVDRRAPAPGHRGVLFATFGLAVTGKLRFAVSPVTLWLGGISYPLYLIHRNLGYSTMFRLHEFGVPCGSSSRRLSPGPWSWRPPSRTGRAARAASPAAVVPDACAVVGPDPGEPPPRDRPHPTIE